MGSDFNPKYDSTFVFTNDFSALVPGTSGGGSPSNAFLCVEP